MSQLTQLREELRLIESQIAKLKTMRSKAVKQMDELSGISKSDGEYMREALVEGAADANIDDYWQSCRDYAQWEYDNHPYELMLVECVEMGMQEDDERIMQIYTDMEAKRVLLGDG